MRLSLVTVFVLLTSLFACRQASIPLELLPPTPTVTPTPLPVSIGVASPVAGNFQLAPRQERRFEVVVNEPGFLLVQVQWQVTGNGLEIVVEVADDDPAFRQALASANLPTLLLEQDLTEPEGEFRIPLPPQYVGHRIRVTLRNATDSSTQGLFSVALEPRPTPTPVPTATRTPTATPTQPPDTFALDVEIRPREAVDLGATVRGRGQYTAGEQVRVEALPETRCLRTSNYVFDRWEGVDGGPQENPGLVVMNGDRSIVAVYRLVENSRSCLLVITPILIGTPLSLSATLKVDAGGTLPREPVTFDIFLSGGQEAKRLQAGESLPVPVGVSLTITANPETACETTFRDPLLGRGQSIVWFVESWQGVDEFSGAKALVTVRSDTSVTAIYNAQQRATVC